MLIDIIEAKPLPDFKLWIKFQDGVSGIYDLNMKRPFRGVFAVLEDYQEFAKVTVNPELGTVCWPNGADLDPDVIYARMTGQPIVMDGVTVFPLQDHQHV